MSAAITSIHDEPAHDWTVEELGQRAGMSRSIFALRFKETVGVSPMEYLIVTFFSGICGREFRAVVADDHLTCGCR